MEKIEKYKNQLTTAATLSEIRKIMLCAYFESPDVVVNDNCLFCVLTPEFEKQRDFININKRGA